MSLFVMILIIGGHVIAQKPKVRNLPTVDQQQFHFGYSVGINTMGFTLIPATDSMLLNQKMNPGININLITNFRLGKYLDLRVLPGIQFGQRDLAISVFDKVIADTLIVKQEWDARIESVYIDLPILLKYRAHRVNNFAPYIVAGVNPRFDLTGGEIENWKPVKRLIKPFDFYPELGVGTDFYLSMVKIALELKFSIGMLNGYNDPGDSVEYELFANGIERMASRMMIMSIHIER